MRLEHYPPERFTRDLLGIMGTHLDLTQYRVFFFGSRVTGTSDERSDIDVGIAGPAPVPAKVKFAIEDAIAELPMLYHVEVVDFATVSSEFRRVALAEAEYISP